jgi:hypothetical protein
MKPRKKAVPAKASLFTSLGENWAPLRKNAIALTLGGIFLYWGQAIIACSRHDHGCIYHWFGSAVHTTNPIASSTDNILVIYAIGTKNGQPSTVDFDNEVFIPALTSSDLFQHGYYVSTGPYIISTTAYGATHPPPDWNPGGNDGALQVYPSRYQVVFYQNTAIAKHNGEFNGGENGNIDDLNALRI